jgi:hypothetical protein
MNFLVNGVGAASAYLREAASAKAGRPLGREAKASPTQPAPRIRQALLLGLKEGVWRRRSINKNVGKSFSLFWEMIQDFCEDPFRS